jgi:hypothetical protein
LLKVQIYINGQRLDLFDNENIVVNSSVQNIKDISRVFNDYSESFSVPATPNNNQIFKHWYNFSIDNGFDARIRHSAILEIETIPFRTGTISLQGCGMMDGRPSRYELTFYGLLIDLKDVIGDAYLNSLDFSEYDITYSSTNVKTGLVTGYSTAEYVFPLISTDKQWLYDSNVATTTEQERLSNIASNGSAALHGVGWDSLRPALKIMPIIELIETTYGVTFSRDFFGTAFYDDLYLWLANQDAEDALNNYVRATDYDSVSTFQLDKGSFDNGTGAYRVTDIGAGYMREMDVRVDSSDGKTYTVQVMNNNTVVSEKSGTGDIDIDVDFPTGVERGSQLYVRFYATAGKVIDSINFRVKELSEDTVCFVDRTTDITISTVTAVTSYFVPQIKILDFLSSLIKLNNLTIIPTSSTEFSVKQLDEWYAEGNTYDISQYVKTGETEVNRPKIFKEISFGFQDPSTILASQYKKVNNTGYGDLETKLKDANGNTLDGEEFEIEVDFEQMVYEKLIDQDTGLETNIVYGLSLTDSLSDTLPEAHILYIRQVDISGNPIYVLNDDSTKSTLNGNVFMPSHTDSALKTYSTTFGSETDEHDGGIITNSLFQRYYKDYITDSFSVKRRSLPITARLPVALLNSLQLNDKLIINGDRYIINEMETNLTTQMVNFELLNDIYGTAVATDITVEEEEETKPSTNDPVTPTVTVKSFDISSSSSINGLGSCGFTVNTKKYWTGIESTPTLGDRVYNEIGATTYFNGGNNYYKISGNRSIQISIVGIVQDLFICSGGSA